MLTQSPSGVPCAQSRMCSIAALAAEAALDVPRAFITLAPRCCTVVMNSPRAQSFSTSALAALPSTVACDRSGYWVAEWLPQMVIRLTALTWWPVRAASCAQARLWSSRVMAEKLRGFMSGAFDEAIRALVFAGFPTTSTLACSSACSLSAAPCPENMRAFPVSKSDRSMPGPRGFAPTRKT